MAPARAGQASGALWNVENVGGDQNERTEEWQLAEWHDRFDGGRCLCINLDNRLRAADTSGACRRARRISRPAGFAGQACLWREEFCGAGQPSDKYSGQEKPDEPAHPVSYSTGLPSGASS
jgi:hypothetical protein